MAAAGPITMCCNACGASYELPVQATVGPKANGCVTLALSIDDGAVILLRQWAESHRGPLAPAR